MIIAQPSRPKIKRQRKNSPHTVQATTPSVTVTAVDTAVLYPSDQVLPAFYVSPTGSDNNSGTEAAPFETIEMARDSMRSSSTTRTYLRGNAGNHNITSTLNLNSNDAGVEFLAYPTESPVIDGGNNGTSVFSITANGNNITIKDLTFQNLAASDSCNYAITTDSTITDFNLDDVVYTGAFNLLVDCNGTQYFVNKNGNGTQDGLSDATAWQTIAQVNAASFSPSDIIQFDKGETYSDDTLEPPNSGTSVIPVVFTSYGSGNQPIIGSTSLFKGVEINGVNNLVFKDLNIKGGDGRNNQSSSAMHVISGSNIVLESCLLESTLTGSSGNTLVLGAGASNILVKDTTVQDAPRRAMNTDSSSDDLYFAGSTFKMTANPDQSNAMVRDNSITSTYFNCIFDARDYDIGSRYQFDFLIGTLYTLNNCQFLGTPGDLQVNSNGTSGSTITVIFNDCLFDLTDDAKGQWVRLTEDVDFTFNRCTFKNTYDTSNAGIKTLSNDTFPDPNITFNACAFINEATVGGLRFIDLGNASTGTFNNCTMVAHDITNTLISLDSTWTGSLVIHNSILQADGCSLINEETGGSGTFNLSYNLYQRDDSSLNWFNFDTEGSLNEADVGVTSPVNDTNSDTGDPDFASENNTNSNFFLVNSGSPAIDLGNNSFNPTTDLVGTSYDDPPNAGCREGNA